MLINVHFDSGHQFDFFHLLMSIHRIKKTKNFMRAECAPLLSAVEGNSTPAIVCVCDSIDDAVDENVGHEPAFRRGYNCRG